MLSVEVAQLLKGALSFGPTLFYQVVNVLQSEHRGLFFSPVANIPLHPHDH